MPKFVTVEEVPEFLSKTLPLDYRIGKAAGSETVSQDNIFKIYLMSPSQHEYMTGCSV